jgi:hypothetical protein
MALTNFPNGITSFGVPVLGTIGGLPFTGNYFFVDPVNGADGNEGSVELPLKTLYGALAKCTAGNNDVVVLIGNGSASGSARLSTALAQEINPAATAGTLNWNKDATHLIGVCAPTAVAQRARIAPPTGTYTATTFGANAFINVTASGCYFANLSVFCGFSTGSATMVAWTDSGSRNAYSNVNIVGMADAASAGGAGARTLKLSGGGEHTFTGCVLGGDTVTRSAANATLELAGGTTRNSFIDCIFPFQTSAATPLGVIVPAASGIDRWTLFKGCSFINNIGSTSTTMSALATLPASAGGVLLIQDSASVGITEFGSNANSLGQIYVNMAAPSASAGGIAVNPS